MKRTFIIAEAGVNHNGSLTVAKRMVDAAAKAGADAVKFQTFKAERTVCKTAPKARYQRETTDSKESQFNMIKRLELNEASHIRLINYCKKKGIIFLSSPFDLESIELLDELGIKLFKIPSGEITNLPYLRKMGSLKKEIIMSSGMADLQEIKNALDILIKSGTPKRNITVLHCNTEYPAPFKDVNLLAMLTIKSYFNVAVGYSDHSLGIEIPIAAVSLGATVIEKHFTLNKKMDGPDHKASLEPDELQGMITAIRNVEMALGDGIKRPSTLEVKNKTVIRKSIVAKEYIQKGEAFTRDNITVKRPAMGISPMQWDSVIGKIAKRDFKKEDFIEI